MTFLLSQKCHPVLPGPWKWPWVSSRQPGRRKGPSRPKAGGGPFLLGPCRPPVLPQEEGEGLGPGGVQGPGGQGGWALQTPWGGGQTELGRPQHRLAPGRRPRGSLSCRRGGVGVRGLSPVPTARTLEVDDQIREKFEDALKTLSVPMRILPAQLEGEPGRVRRPPAPGTHGDLHSRRREGWGAEPPGPRLSRPAPILTLPFPTAVPPHRAVPRLGELPPSPPGVTYPPRPTSWARARGGGLGGAQAAPSMGMAGSWGLSWPLQSWLAVCPRLSSGLCGTVSRVLCPVSWPHSQAGLPTAPSGQGWA